MRSTFEGWNETVTQLRAAALAAEDLLPHTDGQPAALKTAMKAARARAKDAVVKVADRWQRLTTYVPDEDRVSVMQELIGEMASVTELEAAIRRVTDTASDTAVQRAADLMSLVPRTWALLSLVLTLPGEEGGLRDELRTAERTVRAAANQPAQPRTTPGAVTAAQEVTNEVASLQHAISGVFTEAARRLPDWTDAVQRLSEKIEMPLLDASQHDELAAFIGELASTPNIDVASLNSDVVRRGIIAAASLAAAESRANNPAIWRPRAQVTATASAELDGPPPDAEAAEILARAARALLEYTGAQQDDLRKALDQAAGQLPGIESAVAGVLTAAHGVLDTQARFVTTMAAAARALVPHTGGQQATTLTSALDDADERGRRFVGQEPHPATLAGVEAADLARHRVAAAEADVPAGDRPGYRRAPGARE